MLKEEGTEMFEKYWALKKHLDEQKDFEGLNLLIEVLESSSKLLTSLIAQNRSMVEYCNEITEAVKND